MQRGERRSVAQPTHYLSFPATPVYFLIYSSLGFSHFFHIFTFHPHFFILFHQFHPHFFIQFHQFHPHFFIHFHQFHPHFSPFYPQFACSACSFCFLIDSFLFFFLFWKGWKIAWPSENGKKESASPHFEYDNLGWVFNL